MRSSGAAPIWVVPSSGRLYDGICFGPTLESFSGKDPVRQDGVRWSALQQELSGNYPEDKRAA